MEEKKPENFKECLDDELDIFLNSEEFAESIRINQQEFKGVVHVVGKEFISEMGDIDAAVDIILYIQEERALAKYKKGKSIEVNDTFYLINNTFVENGLRVFKLQESVGY